MRAWILLGLLAMTAGCQRTEPMPEWPPFVITIPDDIPHHIHMGNLNYLDGHEVYASGYRSGWRECVRQYEQGRLALDEFGGGEMPIKESYGHAARGWDDGFQTCRDIIRKELSEVAK